MGKFVTGTLVGIGFASAVTWFTRRLDFLLVQNELKDQVQAKWDRETMTRALSTARGIVVNGRPRRANPTTHDTYAETRAAAAPTDAA
jgi:hypothetical protein